MSSSIPYIKKDQSGTYYIHWTENRRGKRVSTRAKDLASAKAFLATWLTMEHSAPDPTHALKIAELWKVYDEKHIKVNVTNTYNAYLSWRYLEKVFGEKTVPEVSQMTIDEYVLKRTRGVIGVKVKPQTARREISYVLAAIAFCAKPGIGLVDPSLVRSFELPEHGEPRRRWLNADEIQKLFAAAAKLRNGDRLSRGERFLSLALETAGRKQALFDLTWDRVDFEANTIELEVPGRQRTKKGRATVPISSSLRPILLRAHKERINNLVLDNKGEIWATLQLLAIEAGLSSDTRQPNRLKPKATGISPHVLRHTAASHMARRGVPLWVIAKILGNSLQMVEKVYAKIGLDDMREAIEKISNGTREAAE